MNNKTIGVIALTAILASGLMLAQTKPAVELEGAIAREQVSGDLKAAIATYQKIAAESSAPRDVRAKALLHLAGCYEKLGQQAQWIYEQIVRDFGDQPAAVQARARLSSYASSRTSAAGRFRLQRLTGNTSELTISAAALSPDGKFVAYSDQLGIHILSIANRDSHLLLGTENHLLLRWMPDGGSVETRVEDASGKITKTIVPLRGGGPTPVATLDQFLASPDGQHGAAVSADQRRISIRDSTGENDREAWKASGTNTVDQLQWRPNSKELAVVSSDASKDPMNSSTLELVKVGTGRRQVLLGAERKLPLASIVWSGQDRMILAINEEHDYRYSSNLWELRLSGDGALIPGALGKLTAWIDFPIRKASLSTDGNRLIFIRSFYQRNVYVAPLEEGGKRMGTPRRLTLDLGTDFPTGWTRDSKTVILTSDRSGRQKIFRQNLNEQTAEQIVDMPGEQRLARVTPGAHFLLFLNFDPAKNKHEQLMRVPIEGGVPQAVPNVANIGFYYWCAMDGPCIIAQKEDNNYIISELDLEKGRGREIYRDSHVEHLLISSDGKWIVDTLGSGTEMGKLATTPAPIIVDPKIILRSVLNGTVIREISLHGIGTLISLNCAPDGNGFFASDIFQSMDRELFIDLLGNVFILWRQPSSGSLWGDPSPDGRFLALPLTTDDSNVYMVEKY